jgi:hypothetical protein
MKIKASMILILIMFVAGCINSTSNLSCENFLGDIPTESINSDLQINVPDHINEFRVKSPIFVEVVNTTRSIIEISPDSDLKIYWLGDNKWETASNQVSYLSVTDLLWPESDSSLGLTFYQIMPIFLDQSAPVKVCVVVEGILKTNDTSSRVLAFTEFTLYP